MLLKFWFYQILRPLSLRFLLPPQFSGVDCDFHIFVIAPIETVDRQCVLWTFRLPPLYCPLFLGVLLLNFLNAFHCCELHKQNFTYLLGFGPESKISQNLDT